MSLTERPAGASALPVMRCDMAPAERRLRYCLRRAGLGYRFRHRHPIGDTVVDFACVVLKLVIDVADEADADDAAERAATLERDGWTVLRFAREDVNRDLDAVCDAVFNACKKAEARRSTQLSGAVASS